MPITIELSIKENDNKVIKLLKQCPALSNQIQKASYNSIRFDISEIALIDYAGGQNVISREDLNFLKQFKDTEIMTPEGLPLLEQTIGHYNLNFFKFVKHCAMIAKTNLSVYYDLERGDWLYESVVWGLDYLPTNKEIVEYLDIRYYDGKADPERHISIQQHKNGQIVTDDWSFLYFDNHKKQTAIHLNNEVEKIARSPSYPYCIEIKVSTSNSKPASSSLNLQEMNHAVFNLFHTKKDSSIAAIDDTEEIQKYIIYSSSDKNVEDKMLSLRSKFPAYRFRMDIKTDPNWDIYKEFRALGN